jgi:DNA-binding HxlR family transcriptional regulator
VSEFRYAQFCPLARATEVVGERWTLLVIRELLLGPRRFSDLKRTLAGVSPSVLSERLTRLEARGVIRRRELPPPTPATLYELADSGRALVPALLELARWGARFLQRSEPGDHFEAAWLRLGFLAFARRSRTPGRSFAIRVGGEGGTAFRVAGGADGTRVTEDDQPSDATVAADSPLAVFALASGQLDPGDAVASGAIRVEGDVSALADFPDLFDLASDSPSPQATGA